MPGRGVEQAYRKVEGVEVDAAADVGADGSQELHVPPGCACTFEQPTIQQALL